MLMQKACGLLRDAMAGIAIGAIFDARADAIEREKYDVKLKFEREKRETAKK